MFATALVNQYTADSEAGLAFYRDLLGFEETFPHLQEGTPEHVELALGGFTLGLGTVEAGKTAHGVDESPGSPNMALVVWTDDVDRAFAHLTSVGAPIVQPPHNSSSNRNALLRDPDGNLVEIVAKVARPSPTTSSHLATRPIAAHRNREPHPWALVQNALVAANPRRDPVLGVPSDPPRQSWLRALTSCPKRPHLTVSRAPAGTP